MLKATEFKIPNDLQRYQVAVRKFVQEELEPWAERLEGMTSTPKELLILLGEAGLLKLTNLKRYGGWELSQQQFLPIMEVSFLRLIYHPFSG